MVLSFASRPVSSVERRAEPTVSAAPVVTSRDPSATTTSINSSELDSSISRFPTAVKDDESLATSVARSTEPPAERVRASPFTRFPAVLEMVPPLIRETSPVDPASSSPSTRLPTDEIDKSFASSALDTRRRLTVRLPVAERFA